MAKFYGQIGYTRREETVPGKWKTIVTEKTYSGEYIRLSRTWQNVQQVNDNLNISAEVSIIADPYFQDHLHEIRYVKINSVAWKVESIEPNHPRYNLRIGGVWNGPVLGGEQAETTSETP